MQNTERTPSKCPVRVTLTQVPTTSAYHSAHGEHLCLPSARLTSGPHPWHHMTAVETVQTPPFLTGVQLLRLRFSLSVRYQGSWLRGWKAGVCAPLGWRTLPRWFLPGAGPWAAAPPQPTMRRCCYRLLAWGHWPPQRAMGRLDGSRLSFGPPAPPPATESHTSSVPHATL